MKCVSAALAATVVVVTGLSLTGRYSPALADDLSYFEKQLEPYLAKPSFVAPGPRPNRPRYAVSARVHAGRGR